MSEQATGFEVHVPPVGVGYERELADREMLLVKRLLTGNGEPWFDYLLADFASYMAGTMLDDQDEYKGSAAEYLQRVGETAAQYALRFRSFASEEQWPAGVTPPAFVYYVVEKWCEHKNQQGTKYGGGMSLMDFLQEDQTWERLDR